MNAAARALAELGTASALLAAERTGLLGSLDSGWRSAAELAAPLDLDPELVGLTLALLAFDGWAERRGEEFRAAPWLLDAEIETPESLTTTSRIFDGLLPALRGDRSGPASPRLEYTEETVRRLGAIFESSARRLLAELGESDLGEGHILDVGAGSAVWSLAYAEAMPRVRVTLLDRPAPLRAALARAERLGVSARVQALEGDAFETPLPPADRVIAANLLHVFDAERARELVARLAASVRPGGRLLLLGQDRDAAPSAAAHALHLRLRRPEASSHLPQDVLAWVAAAGLGSSRALSFGDDFPGLTVVVGERPAGA